MPRPAPPRQRPDRPPLVGVIPGGGAATRLSTLPFSKELMPVGFHAEERGPRPKLVCEYLLGSLERAGVERVLWLLDQSKTDLVRHFGGGSRPGPPIAYVPTRASPSVVHTLDAGYPFLEGCRVAFGFPDIAFEPEDAPSRLVEQLDGSGVDVVLGAFTVPAEQVADRIRTDAAGRVEEVRVKGDGSWPLAWAMAAWAPSFSDFLHDWLDEADDATDVMSTVGSSLSARREVHLGHAVQAAIEAGLEVSAITFAEGSFVDVGTPAGLSKAWQRYGAG